MTELNGVNSRCEFNLPNERLRLIVLVITKAAENIKKIHVLKCIFIKDLARIIFL